MAFIAGAIATLFGILNYYFNFPIRDWQGFLMWTPVLFIIPLVISTYSHISEKIKLSKNKID